MLVVLAAFVWFLPETETKDFAYGFYASLVVGVLFVFCVKAGQSRGGWTGQLLLVLGLAGCLFFFVVAALFLWAVVGSHIIKIN